MQCLKNYVLLEYKRSLKVLCASFGNWIIMLIFLVFGVSLISNNLLQTQSIKKIQVGVVIPEEEAESRLVAEFASAVESVKAVCDFLYFDKQTAMKKLKNGQLQAVVVVPDNFYNDIYIGKNTPATLYFPENSVYDIQMFQEVFADGISWLQVAEAGVYATLNTAASYEIQVDMESLGDYTAWNYIKMVLEREKIYEEETCSPLGGWNLYQYVIIVVITIFLLMSGVNYGFLYEKKHKAVEEKLEIYGIGKLKNAVVKITIMTTVLWFLENVMYIVVCIYSAAMGKGWLWYDEKVPLLMLLLCVSMSVYFHVIFSASVSGYQGTLTLVICNAIMIICSGTVIPKEYMPEITGKLGTYLPLNFWSRYCGSVFFKVVGWKDISNLVVITILGIGIGVVVSWADTWFGTKCS